MRSSSEKYTFEKSYRSSTPPDSIYRTDPPFSYISPALRDVKPLRASRARHAALPSPREYRATHSRIESLERLHSNLMSPVKPLTPRRYREFEPMTPTSRGRRPSSASARSNSRGGSQASLYRIQSEPQGYEVVPLPRLIPISRRRHVEAAPVLKAHRQPGTLTVGVVYPTSSTSLSTPRERPLQHVEWFPFSEPRYDPAPTTLLSQMSPLLNDKQVRGVRDDPEEKRKKRRKNAKDRPCKSKSKSFWRALCNKTVGRWMKRARKRSMLLNPKTQLRKYLSQLPLPTGVRQGLRDSIVLAERFVFSIEFIIFILFFIIFCFGVSFILSYRHSMMGCRPPSLPERRRRIVLNTNASGLSSATFTA